MEGAWSNRDSTADSEISHGHERDRELSYLCHEESSHRHDAPDESEDRNGTRQGRLLLDSRGSSPSCSRQRPASHGSEDGVCLLLPRPPSLRDHRNHRNHRSEKGHSYRGNTHEKRRQDSRVVDHRDSRDSSPELQAQRQVRSSERVPRISGSLGEGSRERQPPLRLGPRKDRSPRQSYRIKRRERDDEQDRNTGRAGESERSKSLEQRSRHYRDSGSGPQYQHIASDDLADCSRRGHSLGTSTKKHVSRSDGVQQERQPVSYYSRTRSTERCGRKSERVHSPSPSQQDDDDRRRDEKVDAAAGDNRHHHSHDHRDHDPHRDRYHRESKSDVIDETPSAWEAAARNALRAGALAAIGCHGAPGDWLGEKGSRVATEALKAAIVDTYMEYRHPESINGIRHTAMRQAAEYAITKALTGPLMQFVAEERKRRRRRKIT